MYSRPGSSFLARSHNDVQSPYSNGCDFAFQRSGRDNLRRVKQSPKRQSVLRVLLWLAVPSTLVACAALGLVINAFQHASQEFQAGIELLEKDAGVKADLGEPIERGFWVGSSNDYSTGFRATRRSVTLTGRKGSGKAEISSKSSYPAFELLSVTWEFQGKKRELVKPPN